MTNNLSKVTKPKLTSYWKHKKATIAHVERMIAELESQLAQLKTDVWDVEQELRRRKGG